MSKDTKRYKCLPLTIARGILLSWNSNIFEDKDTMPFKRDIQSLNILSTFPQYKEGCISKHSLEEEINNEFPWDIFDGSSQGFPHKSGAK